MADFDLGHSYCTYSFVEQCPDRIVDIQLTSRFMDHPHCRTPQFVGWRLAGGLLGNRDSPEVLPAELGDSVPFLQTAGSVSTTGSWHQNNPSSFSKTPTRRTAVPGRVGDRQQPAGADPAITGAHPLRVDRPACCG